LAQGCKQRAHDLDDKITFARSALVTPSPTQPDSLSPCMSPHSVPNSLSWVPFPRFSSELYNAICTDLLNLHTDTASAHTLTAQITVGGSKGRGAYILVSLKHSIEELSLTQHRTDSHSCIALVYKKCTLAPKLYYHQINEVSKPHYFWSKKSLPDTVKTSKATYSRVIFCVWKNRTCPNGV
jgi:hypothetical protein